MKDTYANPSVVGLSAFSTSMLMLQLYNFGLCSLGVVMVTAFVFGGAVQIYSGLQAFQTGDNYEYNMFVSSGAFWMILGGIWALQVLGIVKKISDLDMASFFLCWSAYSAIMCVLAMRINAAMAFLQTFVLVGLLCLVAVKFGFSGFAMASNLFFILAVITSWYMMFITLYSERIGEEPDFGEPWLDS